MRTKLELEIKNLRELKIIKQEVLKRNNEEISSLLSRQDELLEKKKKLVFNSEYEAFKFIDETSRENNLIIEVIGREVKVAKNLDNIESTFFYHGIGKEIDVYNFISQIEKEKRYITLKRESITIEIDGNILDLKINLMYIFNNKKEDLNLDNYDDGMFEKNKSRGIGKKRRTI